MNRIKITAGKYRAESTLILGLFQGGREIEWSEIKPGEEFDVPKTVNGFGYFAEYFPDFGDKEPQFKKI
jgi:hypothetical protein